MISNSNVRIPVTVSRQVYGYLKQVCNIYNSELDKLNFSDKKNYKNKLRKISVSNLYSVAMGNLIMQIDKKLDITKTKEENNKKLFNFLACKK